MTALTRDDLTPGVVLRERARPRHEVVIVWAEEDLSWVKDGGRDSIVPTAALLSAFEHRKEPDLSNPHGVSVRPGPGGYVKIEAAGLALNARAAMNLSAYLYWAAMNLSDNEYDLMVEWSLTIDRLNERMKAGQ